MTRPFEATMGTHADSPDGNDEENTLDRMTSRKLLTASLTGSSPKLSRQSSRDGSRLSNASKTTIESINNNARITTGKKSDNGSSSSSTPELSNRSLLSAKDQRESSDRSLLSAKDPKESKPSHRESVRNSADTISKLPDRPSQSTRRNVQHAVNDECTEPSKQREIDTPKRNSPKTPFTSHKAEKKLKENKEVLKKTSKFVEIENKLEKRKQDIVPKKQLHGKIPSRIPVRYQNNNKKVEISAKPAAKMTESTTAVQRKSIINKVSSTDTSKKIQMSNFRAKSTAVPKPPVKDDNRKTTKFQRRAPLKGASQEKPKLQESVTKKSFKTDASERTSKPSSYSTRKQYSNPLPKTVAEAERLLQTQRKKATSKANITNVEPVAKSDPIIPKTVAEAERLLRARRKKEYPKAHITTVEPVADASTADGQDFSGAKENQDSALDDSQIERYFKLLDEFNENEEKIEENQRKIALQEKEMDETYSNVRTKIEDLADCTGEIVRARKIHKNFKDEAARIRVHHKTNIIAAHIFEAANIDLQEKIAQIHEEIIETKEINQLKPEDLKAKIEEVWKLYDNQRQTNTSLEEEIEQLKNDLNAYKCCRSSVAKLSEKAIKMIHEKPQNDTKPNREAVSDKGASRDKGMRAGESKSADVVSFTKQEREPRETKSEHRPESRFQKIINSARALLPGRKKKENILVTQTSIPDTEKLLQKRHKNESENTSCCLRPTGYVSEEPKLTLYLAPEGRHRSVDQKKSEFVPFTKKPVLHRRPQQNTDQTMGSGISPCIYVPHPPVSSPPETTRVRSLRAINHTSKSISKP